MQRASCPKTVRWRSIAEAATEVSKSFIEHTSSFVTWIKSFLTWDNLFKLIGAILILGIIFGIYKIVLRGIKKIPAEKTTPQRTAILNRIIKYDYEVIIIEGEYDENNIS